jgi:hypothetical protein
LFEKFILNDFERLTFQEDDVVEVFRGTEFFVEKANELGALVALVGCRRGRTPPLEATAK